MLPIRPFIVVFSMLMVLHSAPVAAYQYAYSAPYPYYQPPGYHPAAAYSPYPYGRSYSRPRYQRPAGPARSTDTRAADVGAVPAPAAKTVAPVSEAVSQKLKKDTGLSARKQAFITTLLPYIEDENRRLANLRKATVALKTRLDNDVTISADEQQQLTRLARKYRIDGDPLKEVAAREELLRKIDIIPVSLALAQAVIYLATAPKSNAAYKAYGAARRHAKETGSLMPPKHILNAPTNLMKDLGYGAGYNYDHDAPDAFSGQNYFPDDTERQAFYNPVERGFERDLRKRLDYWDRLRKERQNDG